ncbi:hypothetical protein [Calothrix sp. NIES-2100]|uniref:hypothetical protein n=1 Tax=Calothrix sp. NIES-2100 TaxID=1954172 RepID=UPI0030DA206B
MTNAQSPMQPWKCDRHFAADNKNFLKNPKVRNSRLEFLTWAATIKVAQCLPEPLSRSFLAQHWLLRKCDRFFRDFQKINYAKL